METELCLMWNRTDPPLLADRGAEQGDVDALLECSLALEMVAAEAYLHVTHQQAARTLPCIGTDGPVEEQRLQAEHNSKMQQVQDFQLGGSEKHIGADEPRHALQESGVSADRLWCILVCHPHLTIIICLTAVWAQACGPERKTSFVIIVHLWFIRCSRSFLDPCWCVDGSSITILPLLLQIIRTFATLTNLCSVCAGKTTLQYHDTVEFVQDSETEDPPQLVAEPGVGRNHGKTMGKS